MPTARDVTIWSADGIGRASLGGSLQQLPGLQYVKLDRVGLHRMGHDTIAEVQEVLGYKVFADAKDIEVPSKALEVAETYLVYKPWMLNIMAGACSTGFAEHEDPDQVDALKRFADACHAVGTRPCAVTVLTSKTPEMVEREFGRSFVDQVLFYVELLYEFGFTDIVCSSQEVEAIRSDSRFDKMDTNTPAIRLPEGDAQDQARVNTPARAISLGSTRLVIGRPLSQGDLATNWQRINENLATLAA